MTTSVYPRHATDATPPFVRNLAQGMVKAGLEVGVLAPHGIGAAREEVDAGVRVWRFGYAWPTHLQRLCYEGGMLVNLRERPWTRLLLPSFFAAQLAATARAMRAYRPDLIHSHSLLPQGFTTELIAGRSRLPHLTTCHGNDVFGLSPTGLSGRAKRWVLGRAAAITVNSSVTRQAALAQGAPADRLHLIPAVPNATPADPGRIAELRQSWGENAPVIAFVGRLIAEKGAGELIAAIAHLRPSHHAFRLIIIGDGADRERFEAQARELDLGNMVTFTGWLSPAEVHAHMAAADLVAVPSRPGPGGWKEAQGLVAVEAMSAGTAAVASAFGGLVDMIEDGETGYLCPPGDIDALASALSRALDDPLRTQIAINARRRYAERFSPDAVFRATDALYRALLGARPMSSPIRHR